tara:strand:- start:2438 stop:3970 length:1533 start_codon:yes stop_codon:yes gene_type:complete
MITKDTSGNADFIFGVDMNRLMIDNSAYSALIAEMTDVAKRQVAANSEIMSFNINRRQVKKELSLNSLGGAAMPEVFSDETISHPVLGSISEMREVSITVSGGSSGIKYLTASDTGLSTQTAGTYQYELSISLIDGFIPTMNDILKRLYRTSDDVSNYVALLDIPGNYDSKKRRAKISIREASTDRMSNTYVNALSYFQNLENIDTEYKRASSLIASRGATKESIGTFQKRLNTVISKVEGLISKTGTGATPSGVANQPANSGLPNTPMVEIKQSFNNTISVECRDDKYIDYFSGKGKIGGGLNVYSDTEVKSSVPKTIYLETPSTSLEMLESRGVTFSINSIIETTGTPIQETISSAKYIDSSAGSVGGLLKDDLSPIDLSTISVGNLVSADDINIAVSAMTPKLSSVSSFQAPADKITKVMPKEALTSSGLPDMSISTAPAISTTLVLVATETQDADACSVDTPEPMLKDLQWKPIEEVNIKKGATLLCKQEDGSEEVANAYFVMERR